MDDASAPKIDPKVLVNIAVLYDAAQERRVWVFVPTGAVLSSVDMALLQESKDIERWTMQHIWKRLLAQPYNYDLLMMETEG